MTGYGVEVASVRNLKVEEAERVLAGLFNDYADRYDCCETPVFEPLAEELVRRAEIKEGSTVLDTGTGTGIAAFKALERVGSDGYVLGIDVAEGLLAVARERAQRKGAENIDFKHMSMASMDLPTVSFDRVISNYSVCCNFYHERALREAYRVLKPGGKLTYNHEGPGQNSIAAVFDAVFSKYKVKEPSERLRRGREAKALRETIFGGFRDPFAALRAMEAAGFKGREASVSYQRQIYPTVEAYLDSTFTRRSNELELSEMLPKEREELRNILLESLTPFLSKNGLVLEKEVLHLSGYKKL